MKTHIVLDEQLVKEAMHLSNSKTKKEAVELALINYVTFLKRRSMASLFGKVKWEGDIKQIRG